MLTIYKEIAIVNKSTQYQQKKREFAGDVSTLLVIYVYKR